MKEPFAIFIVVFLLEVKLIPFLEAKTLRKQKFQEIRINPKTFQRYNRIMDKLEVIEIS